MTTITDIANRALITAGFQKVISSLNQDSAEAKAINTYIYNIRDDLLRMAPWGFALKTANLVFISSAPGTPENTSAPTTLWAPGQPPPPWAYEYQYPQDCLRCCWLLPTTQTGFAGGVPITTAVTGGAASFWQGPPVKFQLMQDTFFSIVSVAVASGGLGYAVGDVITLAQAAQGSAPVGAPAQVQVTATGGGGAITSAVPIQDMINSTTMIAGSYFAIQPNPIAQGSTSGTGTGATFNATWNTPAAAQRVICTNQEFATAVYIQQVVTVDETDAQFQRAWINLIAASIYMALVDSANVAKANSLVAAANRSIEAARVADGNESLIVNDVTPDWLRIRGVDFADPYGGPFTGYDWGGMWPIFG